MKIILLLETNTYSVNFVIILRKEIFFSKLEVLVDTERERSFGLRSVLFRPLTRGYHEDAWTCQTFLRQAQVLR